MTTVKVHWPDVETAFERNIPGLRSYIAKHSGDVCVILEGSAEDQEKADAVSRDPDAFIAIEPAPSREQYGWMDSFVATVADDDLRSRLLLAIDGKGAFRRFKDILLNSPEERERWFGYRGAFLHEYINRWFEAKGLIPDPTAPWGTVELPLPAEPPSGREEEGEGPAVTLRRRVRALADSLLAADLPAAQAFLEFLRDRGHSSLATHNRRTHFRREYQRPSGTNTSAPDDDESLDEADPSATNYPDDATPATRL